MCKERDFSPLHHFGHRTKHGSHIRITQNIQIHIRYIYFRYSNSTSGFSKSLENNANYTHARHIVVVRCYRMILANTYRNSYFPKRSSVLPDLFLLSAPALPHIFICAGSKKAKAASGAVRLVLFWSTLGQQLRCSVLYCKKTCCVISAKV